MRSSIRDGAIVRCDIGVCSHVFVNYSMVVFARVQAERAGWGRIKLNMLEAWQDLELGSDGRKKLDACIGCTAKIIAEHEQRQQQKAKHKAEKKAAKGTTKRLAPQQVAEPP